MFIESREQRNQDVAFCRGEEREGEREEEEEAKKSAKKRRNRDGKKYFSKRRETGFTLILFLSL